MSPCHLENKKREAMVKLIDGRQVSSSSEQWRHECEARAILDMNGQTTRRKYLERIELRRGKAERRRLEETILAIYRCMKTPKCA